MLKFDQLNQTFKVQIMTFRSYLPSDRAACIALFKSNMPKYFDPVELPLYEGWLDAQDKGVKAFESDRAEHYFVAELNGNIVACGGISARGEKDAVSMTWGMVDNNLHKQGFGKAFLEFRIMTAEELYPGFEIELDTTQHSYTFFEKYGFSVIKFTEDAYAPGMHRYDMVKGK